MKPAQTGLVLLALGGAAAFAWWRLAPAPATGWQGYVDADYVKVAPTQQGLLTAVDVRRGDTVKAGAALFAQDDTYDHAARDEAAAKLAQSEAQLRNLQMASRETEIAQAEADVADAASAHQRAVQDEGRAEALARTNAGTKQQLDQARADMDSTAAKLVAAQAHLSQMREPTGRAQEIAAQQAVVDEMRAQLGEAQWRLDQRHVTSPDNALVADVLARAGETVNAGTPVVSLLPPVNVFVRFWVPETALARLSVGQTMSVTCDSCPPGLKASVSFVAPQPEYTPPVIFSEQTRGKLVYLIEARPAAKDASTLKPGQPVTVEP